MIYFHASLLFPLSFLHSPILQTEEDDFETDSIISSQGDMGESFRQGARVVVSGHRGTYAQLLILNVHPRSIVTVSSTNGAYLMTASK